MRATEERVSRATSRLSSDAVRRMETLPWFAALPPAQRADVGLVVQAGLAAFAAWLRDPGSAPAPAPEVFNVAPRELARAVSLKQTVALIRHVVGVLEEQVPQLAAPGDEQRLHEAVLVYSREVAFAAAEVYASAAEARGAWDARVESGVVEALVRGQVGELTLSRAQALGWSRPDWVVPLAVAEPPAPADTTVAEVRTHARHAGLRLLVGEAGGGLLVLVGGTGASRPLVAALAEVLPDGPVVVGPEAADLVGAAGPVREVLAALAAVPAWEQAPRLVASGDLLAERAALGDETARARLLSEVHDPLAAAGGDLLRTCAAYLDGGGSVEGAARALFLHPNTVRYRLRKVVDLLGLDVTQPRDALVVALALVVGRARPL